MTRVQLINSKREVVIEFTKDDFSVDEIDLVDYTDEFGNRSAYIFSDQKEDGVVIYRVIGKVAKVNRSKNC